MDRLTALQNRLNTLNELKENYKKGLEIINKTQKEIQSEILELLFRGNEKIPSSLINDIQKNLLD